MASFQEEYEANLRKLQGGVTATNQQRPAPQKRIFGIFDPRSIQAAKQLGLGIASGLENFGFGIGAGANRLLGQNKVVENIQAKQLAGQKYLQQKGFDAKSLEGRQGEIVGGLLPYLIPGAEAKVGVEGLEGLSLLQKGVRSAIKTGIQFAPYGALQGLSAPAKTRQDQILQIAKDTFGAGATGAGFGIGGEVVPAALKAVIKPIIEKRASQIAGRNIVDKTTQDALEHGANRVVASIQGQPLLPDNIVTEQAAQRYFQDARQAMRPKNKLGQLYTNTVENITDPYVAIKFKPREDVSVGRKIADNTLSNSRQYSDSYLAINVAPNKALYELENTLRDYNKALAPLRSLREKQAYEEIRQLQTLSDNAKRGLDTPLTADEIGSALGDWQKKLGKRFDAVIKAAQEANALFNKHLEDLAGISRETKDAMLANNPHYTPLRAISEEPGKIPGQRPMNQGAKNSLKRRTGYGGLYRPDTVNVERETLSQIINAKYKQQVVDKMAKEFGTPVGVRDTKNPYLPGQAPKEITQKIPTGMQELQAKTSDGQIYAVPPKINEYLMQADRTSQNVVTQVFGTMNKVFRAGATTGRIPFILTNPEGDILNYAVNHRPLAWALRNGQGKITIATELSALPRAVWSSFLETFNYLDRLAVKQKAAGGEFGGAFSSIPKEIKIPWSVRTPGQKIGDSLATVIALPYNIISEIGQFTERIPRRAEFLRLEQSGARPEEAALGGLDVTANFSRFGNSIRPINDLIPFTNAAIQGSYSTYQAFRKSPLAFLMATGGFVVAPTVGLSLYNKATGKDDLIDQNTKQNYLYFILPTETANAQGDPVPLLIKFRKKEFPGWVSEITRRLTEGEPLVDTKNVGRNALFSALNRSVPPAGKALIEYATNINLFTQSPIVPDSTKDLQPSYQVAKNTSDTFRKLGELLNMSPAKLEQSAKDLFPAVSQITPLTDKVANPQNTQRAQNTKTPLEEFSQYIPLIGVPNSNTQGSQDLYSLDKQIQQANLTQSFINKRDALQAIAEGDTKRLAQIVASYPKDQRTSFLRTIRETLVQERLTPKQKILFNASEKELVQLLQADPSLRDDIITVLKIRQSLKKR